MKKILFILALILALGITTSAQAATVTVNGTGDNWIWIYDNTSTWVEGTNFYDWRYSDTVAFPGVSLGEGLNFYFAVMNETRDDTDDNPAGFLADVSTDTGVFQETGTSLLVSNVSDWQVAMVPYDLWEIDPPTPQEWSSSGDSSAIIPTFDPTDGSLVWVTPTSNGQNGVAPWGAFAGIDSNAYWLWTDKQFGYQGQGQDNMDYLAVFKVTPRVIPPIPEPMSIALFGMGILGLAGLRRKKS